MPEYCFICPICGNTKTVYRSPTHSPPVYCSQECFRKKPTKPPFSKEQLNQLYWNEGLTTRQMAKHFGVGRRKIEYWMEKLDMPRRKAIETRFPGRQPPTREVLYNHYWIQWLSYQDIAKIYSVDATAVPYWLRKHGIPRRTNWGTRRKGIRIKEPTKQELEELYIKQGFSTRDIGAIYKLSSNTISRRLQKLGIKTRQPGYNQIRYICNDGHIVRSGLEMRVDNWLFDHSLSHVYEPVLPFGGKADFLASDTYIEVWGITGNERYKVRIRTKTRKYRQSHLNLIGLYPKDILKHLDAKLGVLIPATIIP